jgi:hypothetical protein
MEKGILIKKSVFIQEFAADVWEHYEMEKVSVGICRRWATAPSVRSSGAVAGASQARYAPSR